MNELKNHFLHRSIAGLQDLAAELQKGDGQLPRDTFRILHTIKGTAQTFGLAGAATLAHDLEDALASGHRGLLLEGIPLLISALEERDGIDSAEFSQRAGAAAGEKPAQRKTFISRIPRETFNKLSDSEKQRLMTVGGDGLEIFCLHVGFDLASFTKDFKNIKEKLDEAGEVIATLPGAGDTGQISFRIYAATAVAEEISAVRAEYSGELERLSVPAKGDLYGALDQVVTHCEKLAGDLDKDVSIIVSVGDIDPGMDTVKVIFDSLLHLLRNAIDHAFIKKGTIYIGVSDTADGLSINVSDDGRGLDPDELRVKAFEKGLIDADFEGGSLDLIFLPGFSTAETVSEISGRGVGLDAVKDLVTGAGGSITVESEKGKGTMFEIFLPQ